MTTTQTAASATESLTPPDATAPDALTTAHLELDLDWAWRRPKARPRLPKGEPRDDARPLRLTTGDESISSPADSLPYRDGSVATVDAGTVFAYVRNDDGLAREIWRVLRPGGIVTLRVPATGPLAGLDAYNVFRYVVDLSSRGPRAFEVGELGWRRHYAEAEIVAMFGRGRFVVERRRRSGLAISELVRLVGLLGFRWLTASGDGYRRVGGIASRLEERELHVAARHGFWLTLTLRKYSEDDTRLGSAGAD